MNRKALLLIFTTCLIVSAGIPVGAQDSIKEIKRTEPEHKLVTVVGTVTQLKESVSGRANFFYLQGDFGAVIRVRSSDRLPKINERIRVDGRVTILPSPREVIIDEQSREILEGQGSTEASEDETPSESGPPSESIQPEEEGAPPESDPVDTDNEVSGQDWMLYLLFGGIAVIFIIIVVLVFMLVRKPAQPAVDATGADVEASPAAPSSGDDIDGPIAGKAAKFQPLQGKTIKLNIPPAGTMKMLPGFLEVVEGEDKFNEIRFFLPKGRREAEFTFGRGGGATVTHFQLSHGTVSVKQAKIIQAGSQFQLINYSTTNNTRVNGQILGENESVVLNDGDEIQMGIVKFIYHAS